MKTKKMPDSHNVRFEPSLFKKFLKYCKDRGITQADAVRVFIVMAADKNLTASPENKQYVKFQFRVSDDMSKLLERQVKRSGVSKIKYMEFVFDYFLNEK